MSAAADILLLRGKAPGPLSALVAA
jgi:hypothetical protein